VERQKQSTALELALFYVFVITTMCKFGVMDELKLVTMNSAPVKNQFFSPLFVEIK